MGPPYFASTNGQDAAPPKTYYEQQREMLVTEIAQVRATEPITERIAVSQFNSPNHVHPNKVPESGSCPAKHQQVEPFARGGHVGRERIRARRVALEPL